MTQDATSQRLKVISRVTRLSKATSPCTASVVPTLGAAVFIPNVLKNVQLLRKIKFKTSKQLLTWWSGTCGLIDNILQPARDSDGSFLEILWPLTSFCDGKRRFYTTWIMGLNKKHTNLVITNFNAPCWKVQPCEQLKHLHMPDHQMKGSDPKMRKQDCIFSGHSDTFVLNNLFRITQRESIYVPSN